MSFYTQQFKQVSTPSGKKAFEAWLAVYENDGAHVVIAAPTLALLGERYKEIACHDLDEQRAQHVWIVRAE